MAAEAFFIFAEQAGLITSKRLVKKSARMNTIVIG